MSVAVLAKLRDKRDGRPARDAAPSEPGVPGARGSTYTGATPELMATFATSEQRLVEQLGGVTRPAGSEVDEVRQRLEAVVSAHREVAAIIDERERQELERARQRAQDRIDAASDWLDLGLRAWRSALGAFACAIAAGALLEAVLAGRVDLGAIVRLMPW